MYPEETKTEKDTCIPLFTAALFTVARTWQLHGAGASSHEEIPYVQGQKQWLHFAGASSCEEITHVQSQEQWLGFAGAAVRSYRTTKVRETPVRR